MTELFSVGVTDDSTYRFADKGGWFTYRMAVDETAPLLVLHAKAPQGGQRQDPARARG